MKIGLRLICLFSAIVSYAQASVSESPSSIAFKGLVNRYTEEYKRLDAFQAPNFNVEEDLSKFGDFPSPSFYRRQKQLVTKTWAQLKKISMKALSPKDAVVYQLLAGDLEVALRKFEFPDELLEFNQLSNRLHSYLDDSSQDLTSFPFDSVKHYNDFIERSYGFPAYVEAQIALLRKGIREKIVLSCAVAARTPNTYRDGLETNLEKNPFWRPVTFMPKTFSASEKTRIAGEFRKMIRDRILPGFQKFDTFFQKEYLPNCQKEYFGIGRYSKYRKWYAYEVQSQTNLTLNPKEIHQIGLREVARIRAEMERIKKAQGFHGSFKEYLKSLTENPHYFFGSSHDMFEAFLKVKAGMQAKIPLFFNQTPKSDFKIVTTSNPEEPAGMYFPPTENIPHGRFVVNTLNLRSVPLYDVTTLMLHETTPGHHFQMALQYEMKDQLTEYQRKIFYSNSFVEGWALYTEHLGKEMGMFTDPLQLLGNLNDDMLRAVRLVVDTGIHAFNWTQLKAIQYMTENIASDAKDIEVEVNRYSVSPGQALGYKLGQLKIIELRKLAEQELGPKFNLRAFHDVVIGQGAVSLGLLETRVKDWIGEIKK